jgi:hypothetical protein
MPMKRFLSFALLISWVAFSGVALHWFNLQSPWSGGMCRSAR